MASTKLRSLWPSIKCGSLYERVLGGWRGGAVEVGGDGFVDLILFINSNKSSTKLRRKRLDIQIRGPRSPLLLFIHSTAT